MIQIFIVLSIIIAAAGLGLYIQFAAGEGADERGNAILAKASHVTVSFLFAMFSVLLLVVTFSNPSAELLTLMMVLTFSLLICINSASIMYFRQRI